MASDRLIEFQHISKIFPPETVALADVSVTFNTAEIHALVGENGAGKSTLMKVLYGLERPDNGKILYHGHPVAFAAPRDAIAAGIGMVHQEILLIPEYTVWQNIVLGAEPARFGRLDVARARKQVLAKIQEFGFNLDPDAIVGDISVAARQKVEILKLLYRDVSVLILDEPTAVLTPQEIPQLFSELRRLRDGGHTIVFISHRLDEVLELSDQVTVMRRGKVIATEAAQKLTREDLARLMVGREILFTSQRMQQEAGPVVLDINGLSCSNEDRRIQVSDLSLKVHAGEIVGVAGVEGNGQFEMVNALMGLTSVSAGTIRVQGHDITRASILERRSVISFVPQDRSAMGASVNASILENSIMTHHLLDPTFSQWHGLVLNRQRAKAFTEQVWKQFDVSMEETSAPFHSLSGGNQQKIILGRELLLNTPFVLMDQPTRGLDVGSIEYVHRLILDLRKRQKAVLLISADLDELFMLADRIVVLCRGQIVADKAIGEMSREETGWLMLGGKGEMHAETTS